MEKTKTLDPLTREDLLNVALDTLKQGKQALVFVNSKKSAEKVAADIAKHVKKLNLQLKTEVLAKEVYTALEKPTVQCKKLSECTTWGIAFHHAGLVTKQRELIEDHFRSGELRIICSTPTLAAGLDMPAFRAIIRDLKRYGGRFGMTPIPVLEYHQMAGRAGRPSYDTFGEAICIAKNEEEKISIVEKYFHGKSEDITSKLAVEPILRTYTLSLIASGFVTDRASILDFFSQTFWAFQYGDMVQLELIVEKILGILEEWEFILSSKGDFVNADAIDSVRYKATRLGKRVSELYIDPYSAHLLIEQMNVAHEKGTRGDDKEETKLTLFSILMMICQTLEVRPLQRIRTKEYDLVHEILLKRGGEIFFKEPSLYDDEYEDFLSSVKTARLFEEWCDEQDEEYLLEQYQVRPGELRYKLGICDWLLYCCHEISKIVSMKEFGKEIAKARIRMQYGVCEELLILLKLKGIGRVRARKLFNNKIRDVGDLKRVDPVKLGQLVGSKTAENLKEQVGEKVTIVKENKRVGQKSMKDW